MPGAKPREIKKTIGRVLSYLEGYRGRLVLVAFCLLVSSGSTIAGTYFLKPLFNTFLRPLKGQQNPDLTAFAQALTAMGALYLAGVVAVFLQNRIMLTVSTGALYRIRAELFAKMEKLPISYFDTHATGDLMSRYTNDMDTLRQMLSQSLPQFLTSCVTIVGVFVAMLLLSPLLTALMMAMMLLNLRIIKVLGGRSGRGFARHHRALGAMNGYIEEMMEGQKVVKVFCYEDKARAEFDRLNRRLAEAGTEAHTAASVLMPIMGNLSYLHYAVIAVAGSALAIGGGMDLGSVAAFLQYSRSFSQPITQLSQQFNTLLSALAGAERIFKLMDETPETDEGDVTLVCAERGADGSLAETASRTGLWAWKVPEEEGVRLVPLAGAVVLKDVDFSYDGIKPVLKKVSLYAKPGQKIAFVGSTGAGKTTITNLINRFYEVSDGEVTYDGIPLQRIKKPDLRRSLGMVLQDTHLFTGTVMENIRYGRLDASDDEVRAAAVTAGADGFIRMLPQGYDTPLTADGGNLSQGQRQLLAIARAAVADPPVLVLDEATSSIDTRTEA
ncbi:MAG: ABC transporter ATP-binding protein, partial [Clostridia bacterium]|nr:ABC transporter ATP-binding protein [Clostridia bacterium]